MGKDGGVRRKPRQRPVLDVAFQRAAGQQFSRDVIEPNALSDAMQLLNRIHCVASLIVERSKLLRIVPKSNYGMRQVVFVAQNAEAARAQKQIPAYRRFTIEPTSCQYAQEVP